MPAGFNRYPWDNTYLKHRFGAIVVAFIEVVQYCATEGGPLRGRLGSRDQLKLKSRWIIQTAPATPIR